MRELSFLLTKLFLIVLAPMFHEELGYILEVKKSDLERVSTVFQQFGVKFEHLGVSTKDKVWN